jgi:hypothetical protein
MLKKKRFRFQVRVLSTMKTSMFSCDESHFGSYGPERVAKKNRLALLGQVWLVYVVSTMMPEGTHTAIHYCKVSGKTMKQDERRKGRNMIMKR